MCGDGRRCRRSGRDARPQQSTSSPVTGLITASLRITERMMVNEQNIKVTAEDFQSLGQKLEALHSTLSEGEAHVFGFLMESASAGAGQIPAPAWITPYFKYKPRGARQLVTGGADGLTVLLTGRGKLIVVKPEGPLPVERPADVLAAIPIRG